MRDIGEIACPGCDRGHLEPMAELGRQPAVGTVVHRTVESARAAVSVALDIGFCRTCGLMRALDFDPALVPYDESYENSQHFSPRFARYAREIAADLVERHELDGGTVIEIGSGKGEFLAELCRAGVAEAHGYDASYDDEIVDDEMADRIHFVRRDFDPGLELPRAGLLCCRHVLEHLVDPARLLLDLRRSLGPRGTPIFFEVPNGEFVLTDGGMWDFIYQHVSYFTETSLQVLFARCGFEITDLRRRFDDQFLTVEATPTLEPGTVAEVDAAAVDSVSARAEAFASRYEEAVTSWNRLLAGRDDVVLWGAGSKGVTFLNITEARHAVRAVVDLNPRKQGTFVAGTGQPVIAPDDLVARPPGLVLVSNPAYVEEIGEHVARLGISAPVRPL